MASLIPHAVLAAVLVGSLIAACGGRTADLGPGSPGGSSGGSSGSSGGTPNGSSGSPSSSGVASSTGSVSGSGTGTCIDINPSTFDQSCIQSSDCVPIASGTICTGVCFCEGGDAAINVGDQSRYFAEVSAVGPAKCGCPNGLPPACSNHKCVACTGNPTDPPECGPTVIGIEAGVGPVCKELMVGGSIPDGGSCTLEAFETCSDGTTYDVSCSCPAATCSCTQSGPSSGSSGGPFPFSGCAEICGPMGDVLPLYEACHFPLPQ